MTCNKLPSFGDETENVRKRLAIFHTKEIRNPVYDAPDWIENHAMDCLVWMINLINNNKQLLYREERFYEREYDDFVPDDKDNKLEELSKLKNVDIDEIQIDPIPQAESVPSVEEPVKKDFQPDYPSWMLRLRKQGKVIKLYDSCYSKFQNLPF